MGKTQPVIANWCQKRNLKMRIIMNNVVFVCVYYSQTKALRAAKFVPLDSAGSIYPRQICKQRKKHFLNDLSSVVISPRFWHFFLFIYLKKW